MFRIDINNVPAGRRDEARALARRVDGDLLEFDSHERRVRSLLTRTRPVAKTATPTSSSTEEWPTWARWLADRRADGDRGVGDTVERLLGVGGRAFKLLWKATFGQVGLGCGCDGRRARWNAAYAYAS